MTENFEDDFYVDPELERFLDALSALILADERRTSVLNIARFQEMQAAWEILRALARDMEGVKLTCAAHEPFKSMGYISLEGESLEIPDPVPFARAAALADNLEVYPLASGRVRLTLTFLGLTTPIE